MEKLIITEDGSPTLRASYVGEYYHSIHGAIQESRHVFIDAALRFRLAQGLSRPSCRVFEIGFGTGLNALLTLVEAINSKQHIHYYTAERYPVDLDTASLLYYDVSLEGADDYLKRMHAADWNVDVPITDYFVLHKISGDICEADMPRDIDVIYMDAFSPDVEPMLWSERFFSSLYAAAASACALATYSAKGEVRRRMAAVGFEPERIPGPPGKRQMLRATKP